ncbi:MAG: type II secretion system protein [Patescibacteria group bacterium]
MNTKKGFTLIELLVVISIIGLLSSMAVYAINSARVKARDTKRKADLKQVQLALELFYDNNNTYPSETYCDSSMGSCDHACPCEGSDWDYSNANYFELRN